MARLADDAEEPCLGQELRQHVVLDVARHARLAGAVAVDDVDLPVVARHHLERDAAAVRRQGGEVDALRPLAHDRRRWPTGRRWRRSAGWSRPRCD